MQATSIWTTSATPARRSTIACYYNKHLATALEKAQSMAVLMDGLGYNAFWMAEHHFQREGTECIPNVLMMALHLTHVTQEPEDRLRLQHRADVASAAPGRGLRDGGHPQQRPGDLRSRPWLSHARGGDVRVTADRSGRQSRAVRGAGRYHLQGVQRRVVQPQGQALHAAAGGAVSRLHAEGADAGAAAGAAAGGDAGSRSRAAPRGRWNSWRSTASRAW